MIELNEHLYNEENLKVLLLSESLYMFLVPLTTKYQILKNITKYGHVMIDLEIHSNTTILFYKLSCFFRF